MRRREQGKERKDRKADARRGEERRGDKELV